MIPQPIYILKAGINLRTIAVCFLFYSLSFGEIQARSRNLGQIASFGSFWYHDISNPRYDSYRYYYKVYYKFKVRSQQGGIQGCITKHKLYDPMDPIDTIPHGIVPVTQGCINLTINYLRLIYTPLR